MADTQGGGTTTPDPTSGFYGQAPGNSITAKAPTLPSGIPDPNNPGYDTNGYRLTATMSNGTVSIPNAGATGSQTASFSTTNPLGTLAFNTTPPPQNPTSGLYNSAYYAPFTGAAPTYTTPPAFQAPTLDQAAAQPGYQFGLQQGEQALQQSAAAKGLLRSGGTLKDIFNYGNAAATQNYGNVLGQDLGIYNTNVNTQYTQPYQNAFATYLANRDQFYQNQQNPWQKYYSDATLGSQSN